MSSSSTETEGSLVPEHREILKASSRLLSLHPGQYVNQEPERVVNEEASGAHNKRQKCTQVLPHKSDHAVGENDKAMETCKPTGRLKINTMSATNELDFCGHEEPPQVAAATTMTRAPDHSSVTIATTTAEGNEETSSRASLNDLQLATATTTLTTTTTTEPSPSEVIFLDLTKRAITECKELGALHADCRVLLQKVQSFHIDCRAVEKDMEESMGPWLLQKACNDVLESNDVVPHEAGRDRVHVQSTDLPDLITMPSIGDADTNRLTILGAFLDEAAQQKRVLADTRNVLTAEIERQKALLRQVKLECKELQSEYQVLSNKWKVIQRKLRSEAS